jgi:signal transduction histidine kinase
MRQGQVLIPKPLSARNTATLLKWLAYGCAVTGPLLARWITAHTPALHGIPFSLNFVCIAALAAFGGLGPALVGILVSIASFGFHPTSPQNQFSFTSENLERASVLFAAAFCLTALAWKQRRAESRLRATLASLQERTEALSQAQQAGEFATWLFNSETMTAAWDEGSTEIFGCPFEEFNYLTSPLDYVVPEDRDRVCHTVTAAVASGAPIQFEFRVRWPNGDIHWLEARGTRVHPTSSFWRGVTFNITRRKAVEAALVRSEKLAAMGRLASTVAHEVNNPLEAVTNLLYLARTDPTLKQATHSYLTLAEEELARLSKITRLTLSFVRTKAVSGPIQVSQVLDGVLSMFRCKCEEMNVTVERAYTPGVHIEIAEHELRQILINLLSNAVDALGPGQPRIRLQTLHLQDKVALIVEDNGHGIQVRDKARVFDPFFTTKEEVGTGIGLWVTKELVEKNAGHITVDSGDLPDTMTTRFRLEFPAAAVREPVGV